MLLVLVAALLAALLVPVAGVAVVLVGVLALFDWRRRRLLRALVSRPRGGDCLRARLARDGRFHDANGPIIVRGPWRVWSSSWLCRSSRLGRPRGDVEIEGVVTREVSQGGYRSTVVRTLVSPREGAAELDVFCHDRVAVERAFADVYVSREMRNFALLLVFLAVAATGFAAAILSSLFPWMG